MKRAIHVPYLLALLATTFGTAAALRWIWQRSLLAPGDIGCNNGGYSVMACDTDFGNYATALLLIAAPIIAWLVHKAFFSRFKRGR